jgi:hypothetical protein
LIAAVNEQPKRAPSAVDDLHTDPVLLQEQGRDETDRTGADDEDLRIGATKHRGCSRARCAKPASRGRFGSGHQLADAATSELGVRRVISAIECRTRIFDGRLD